MDITRYIGETTEYDKKQEVERRKVKSWLKSVNAFANGEGGCLLFGIADDDTVVGLVDAKGDSEFISQKIKERIDPIKALPYFSDRMLPKFFSDRAQFTITFPNIIKVWEEEHSGIEIHYKEGDTQDDTQDDTQGDTQDVPQSVPQGNDLDKWIEYQVAVYPKISTVELANLSGKSVITIKRHIAKMPHIVYVGSGYSGHWEVRSKE